MSPIPNRRCWISPWSIRPAAVDISSSPRPGGSPPRWPASAPAKPNPPPPRLRAATADVIEHCVYGVDLNDLAIEITKVALWLEAFDADRPFPFLDAHFRVGNALLGTTPELLRQNIPDIGVRRARRRRQRVDVQTQGPQQVRAPSRPRPADAEISAPKPSTSKPASSPRRPAKPTPGPSLSVAALRARADAWRRLEADPDLVAAKLVADAWCAAFVQPKDRGRPIVPARASPMRPSAHCPKTLNRCPTPSSPRSMTLARQYRFFHWHLEFPGIFTVPDDGSADAGTGWTRRVLLRRRQPAVGAGARSRTRSSSATSAAPTSRLPRTRRSARR